MPSHFFDEGVCGRHQLFDVAMSCCCLLLLNSGRCNCRGQTGLKGPSVCQGESHVQCCRVSKMTVCVHVCCCWFQHNICCSLELGKHRVMQAMVSCRWRVGVHVVSLALSCRLHHLLVVSFSSHNGLRLQASSRGGGATFLSCLILFLAAFSPYLSFVRCQLLIFFLSTTVHAIVELTCVNVAACASYHISFF